MNSLILAGFQANLEKMFTGVGRKVEVPSKGKAETPGPLTGLHQTTVPTGTGTPQQEAVSRGHERGRHYEARPRPDEDSNREGNRRPVSGPTVSLVDSTQGR